jgi:hypothetical protein
LPSGITAPPIGTSPSAVRKNVWTGDSSRTASSNAVRASSGRAAFAGGEHGRARPPGGVEHADAGCHRDLRARAAQLDLEGGVARVRSGRLRLEPLGPQRVPGHPAQSAATASSSRDGPQQ